MQPILDFFFAKSKVKDPKKLFFDHSFREGAAFVSPPLKHFKNFRFYNNQISLRLTFPIANNAASKNNSIPRPTNVTPNNDKPMPISKNADQLRFEDDQLTFCIAEFEIHCVKMCISCL